MSNMALRERKNHALNNAKKNLLRGVNHTVKLGSAIRSISDSVSMTARSQYD